MKDRIHRELERIRIKSGGLLRPEAVVEAARNPKSPLHSRFCWNDRKAAHEYRLWQARELIRVHVCVLRSDVKPVRTYVSLIPDRHVGNGYRAVVDVLADADLREQLLAQARDEMRRFRAKYAALRELADVFEAMTSAERRLAKRRRVAG